LQRDLAGRGRQPQVLERSEEIEELFSGEAGLFDDCSEGASLEVGGVNGDRDPKLRPARVSEVVMAAGDVMERKASSLQGPDHLPGPEGRQARRHAAWSTTVIFSLIGSGAVSSGIGRPSLVRLSR
jgi:hypothetical protein